MAVFTTQTNRFIPVSALRKLPESPEDNQCYTQSHPVIGNDGIISAALHADTTLDFIFMSSTKPLKPTVSFKGTDL